MNWVMIRVFDAPSAVRMPTSLVRIAARLISRFATLAHAISSTKKTAPSIVYSIRVGSSPMYSSVNGLMTGEMPSFVSGYSAASRCVIPVISIIARSIVTPSRRRPSTSSVIPSPRFSVSGSSRSGTQIWWLNGKRKSSGITPMIVAGSPFTRMTRPTMPGSPSYLSCHMR